MSKHSHTTQLIVQQLSAHGFPRVISSYYDNWDSHGRLKPYPIDMADVIEEFTVSWIQKVLLEINKTGKYNFGNGSVMDFQNQPWVNKDNPVVQRLIKVGDGMHDWIKNGYGKSEDWYDEWEDAKEALENLNT